MKLAAQPCSPGFGCRCMTNRSDTGCQHDDHSSDSGGAPWPKTTTCSAASIGRAQCAAGGVGCPLRAADGARADVPVVVASLWAQTAVAR